MNPTSLENQPPLDEHGGASPPVSETQALWLSAVISVLVFAVLAFVVQPESFYTSDFYSFWAGSRAGSHLYNPSEVEAIQHSVSPLVTSKRYIRPPFYALMLWPLGQLPFRLAYVLWFLVNLAAVLAFVRLWRFRPATYIACAFFLPLGWSFGGGQDAPLVLVTIAAGARLIERKREVAGGALLALCAVKPHLALFIPVALLAQRRHRALLGMLASGGALYLLSSAVLGLNWPAAFIRAALDNEATIRPRLLGFAGLLARFGVPDWTLVFATVAAAAMVFYYARAARWLPSIAFALAAGVAVAPRAMVYDASLFLPLLLLQFSPPVVVALGAALLTVVTPAAIISEVTALTLVAIPFYSRRLKATPRDSGR